MRQGDVGDLSKSIMKWKILALSIFLRFYHLNNRFLFTLDEEYQATLAKTIIDKFHIIWVGVSASSGFYLGPFWTYFTAFWLSFSKLDPLITGYVSSGIGVITTIFIYFVGKRVFDRKTALIASLLYATLPMIVYFDQRYWNPTLVPLLSLIMFFCLSQVKYNPQWWIVFAGAMGLVFHTHLSLLVLVPIGLVTLWIYRKVLTKNIFLLSTTTFLIIVSPIIAFEVFHKFANHNIVHDETTAVNPLHKLQALFQFSGRFFHLNSNGNNADEVQWSCSPTAVYNYPIDTTSTNTVPHSIVSWLGILMFVLFLLKPHKLLAVSIGVFIIGYIFFPGLASEYYLLGTFSLLVFIPGILIKNSPRFLQIILVGLFGVILPLLGIVTVLTNHEDFGMLNRKNLIEQVMVIVRDDPYVLLEDGNCHHWEGWRYLFTVYGRKPERSSVDNTLGWLYPNEVSKIPAKYNVIVYEERGDIKLRWNNYWKKVTSGGYSASIYKNP